MSKDRFERNRLHDTNMKTVIIRLDYAGVIDNQELVKMFDKRFPSAFKSRQEIHNSEFTINLRGDDLKDISDTLSVPVSVIQRERVYRYQGLKEVACAVTLDISQYYLCMTINCQNNYDGLDKYVEYFKGAISVFSVKNSYFQPKRLGLRKIRVEDKSHIEDFNSVFESFVFDIPGYSLSPSTNLKTEYFDYIECPNKDNLRFNIHRAVNRLEVRSEQSVNYIYKSILDIDAYYKSENLNRINELLTQANVEEFRVYKACMKESYLNSIYR